MRVTSVMSASKHHFGGGGLGRATRLYSKVGVVRAARKRRVKYPDGSAARLLDGAGYHNLQPLTDTTEARSDARARRVVQGPSCTFFFRSFWNSCAERWCESVAGQQELWPRVSRRSSRSHGGPVHF